VFFSAIEITVSIEKWIVLWQCCFDAAEPAVFIVVVDVVVIVVVVVVLVLVGRCCSSLFSVVLQFVVLSLLLLLLTVVLLSPRYRKIAKNTITCHRRCWMCNVPRERGMQRTCKLCGVSWRVVVVLACVVRVGFLVFLRRVAVSRHREHFFGFVRTRHSVPYVCTTYVTLFLATTGGSWQAGVPFGTAGM
jgi:lysylphosphatidylglycerol synthetase-like protein (DUF2156 family)